MVLKTSPTGTWLPAWVPESQGIMCLLLMVCSIVQAGVSWSHTYDSGNLVGVDCAPVSFARLTGVLSSRPAATMAHCSTALISCPPTRTTSSSMPPRQVSTLRLCSSAVPSAPSLGVLCATASAAGLPFSGALSSLLLVLSSSRLRRT